ncbi:hypothetical protein MPDQ_002016 [Monascus purpureus]|uniref:mRNA N(6)-methyladenine demethylase n=1 Tax=Monascus purpureus TaxID=5098 RepID=A0A507R3D1_MONPU|nr:hypothetical protein MPDQ_002016 [Monascus purpureus]
MAQIRGLNAHDRPPEVIRQQYKKYVKMPLSEVELDPGIIDPRALDLDFLPEEIFLVGMMSSKDLRLAFDQFIKGTTADAAHSGKGRLVEDLPIFSHKAVTGLRIVPALLPPTVQFELLSRLFHRDLPNKEHQTNIHLHYDVTYPAETSASISFFEDDPTRILHPKNPEVHKPITVQSLLDKKLRWMTLGGQYNWTSKEYPLGPPPPFPQDIANLLRVAFPETDAQAAIVNVYAAGDTLSMHRDVSEECDAGLISISFGCDGLFMISHDNGDGCEIIRLHSGDAVYMDGHSRFAWHGVPKILPSTCPSWLVDWPCSNETDEDPYRVWKGWMSGKRVNLNVRQMAGLTESVVTGH